MKCPHCGSPEASLTARFPVQIEAEFEPDNPRLWHNETQIATGRPVVEWGCCYAEAENDLTKDQIGELQDYIDTEYGD